MRIRFPVSAVMSIGHRIAGVLLFLTLPLLIYLLQLSVQSEQAYQDIRHWLDLSPVRLLLAILIWALVHHLLAGIRVLFIDIDLGVSKGVARSTAWLVNLSALTIFLLALAVLL